MSAAVAILHVNPSLEQNAAFVSGVQTVGVLQVPQLGTSMQTESLIS
ncbi:MAG TPA: hypothetical protein VIG99_14745 [Myxococcaceae bacterium]